MKSIEELERRKSEIIAEIQEIQTMRRGSINEQYLKVPRQGKEPSIRGPYYVLARNENGKTVSIRINNPEELDLIQRDIESYKKFTRLSKEFVFITETITDIIRGNNIMESKKNRKYTGKNTTVK
jgi:hypothetical protein